MKRFTKKQSKRLIELYEQAVATYLDKTDWDMSEWLTPEEWEEYQKLEELEEAYYKTK